MEKVWQHLFLEELYQRIQLKIVIYDKLNGQAKLRYGETEIR